MQIVTSPAQEGLQTVLLPQDKVDLCLTSPPYGDLELYPDAPGSTGQVHASCCGNEQYLSKFAFPVLNQQIRMLGTTGVIALNICDNKDREVEICQPILDYMGDQPTMEFVGTLIMTQQGDHDEPIYVWCHEGQGDRVRAAILPQAAAAVAAPTKKPVARPGKKRRYISSDSED